MLIMVEIGTPLAVLAAKDQITIPEGDRFVHPLIDVCVYAALVTSTRILSIPQPLTLILIDHQQKLNSCAKQSSFSPISNPVSCGHSCKNSFSSLLRRSILDGYPRYAFWLNTCQLIRTPMFEVVICLEWSQR